MFPAKGDGPEAESKAIEMAKNRFIGSLHANPVGHYIQILDADNNDAIVAAAYWSFFDHEHNPYLEPSDTSPGWWPAESEIWKYTKMARYQGQIPRLERQRRPHAHLGMCFTNLAYRRCGAGRILMDWGTKKADEMGLECFLDSTEIGVPLYESSQFIVVDETPLDVEIDNPSDEWKELQKKYPLHPQINMWRPVRGNYKKGEKYPWED